MMTPFQPPEHEKTLKPDGARALTQKILEQVIAELNKPDAQERINGQIIDPLIRLLYTQMSPYVMVICAVMLIILLTSMCTCTMFALFFFKGK